MAGKRGRKSGAGKGLQPREPLRVDPPAELSLGDEATVEYRKLARRLQAEGFAAQSDQWVIGMAANSLVTVRLLERTIAALGGHDALGKLAKELRAEKTVLAGLLDRLFLSPRSRARGFSRGGEGSLRQAGPATDDLSEFLT